MKTIPPRLISTLTRSVSNYIKYIQLDTPNSYYFFIDNALDTLTDKRTYKKYYPIIDNLPYKQVKEIEEKINNLLHTDKYN